jgi:hypothetical protein
MIITKAKATHPGTGNDNDILRLLQQVYRILDRVIFIQFLTLRELSRDDNTK